MNKENIGSEELLYLHQEKLKEAESIEERLDIITEDIKKKTLEQENLGKKFLEEAQISLDNLRVANERLKKEDSELLDKNKEKNSFKSIQEKLKEIESKIIALSKDLNNRIDLINQETESNLESLESHPNPEEIKSRLDFREANEEEKERLETRISLQQKKALKTCARIFNQCQYPWYVTGSIAFLINATESKKQADDIDIIFHEEDFAEMKDELLKLGFETGIAAGTNCPFLKGKIEVLADNNETVTIDVEAFAQKTEEPNGLIKPGSKEKRYQVIKNQLSNDSLENFDILDKDGQIELYFKNLSSEIKGFNFESLVTDKEQESKSNKFINRLVNLFELNGSSQTEVLRKVKKLCKTSEDNNLLAEFVSVSKEFIKNKRKGKGLAYEFNAGSLQLSIENLKEIVKREQAELKKNFLAINEEMKKIEALNATDKEKLSELIDEAIYSRKELIDRFFNAYKKINSDSSADLAIFILSDRFEKEFLAPFCEKLENFKKELNK